MKELTNLPSIDKTHLKQYSLMKRHPIIPGCISVANTMNIMAFNKDRYAIDCMDLRVKGKQIMEDSKILAKTMIQLGIKKGDIVTCQMPNLYQAFLVFHAANSIGAITTYLSPQSTKEEIADYLKLYESKLLFNMKPEDSRNEYYLFGAPDSPLEYIISLDEKNVNNRNFYLHTGNELMRTRQFDFNEIGHIANLQKGKYRTWFTGSQEALILHTSGSTGKPKSMVFTNKNILSALIFMGNGSGTKEDLPENLKWLVSVPMMYPYATIDGIIGPLTAKKEVILVPEVNRKNILEAMKYKPNIVMGSPALLEMFKKNVPEGFDLSSINMFVSGGDFLSPEKSLEGEEFFRKHGAETRMANGAGNGEVCGCFTSGMDGELRRDTVGLLVPGPKTIFLDSTTKKEAHYDEPGVAYARGPHVFKEYYKNPEETKKVKVRIRGKVYYNTGNYGILSKSGHFKLIGRASRFYIASSLNKVYCEGVQARIDLLEPVDQCIVVPKPKDGFNEGKAYIKLKEGFEPSEETKDLILSSCYLPYNDPNTGEKLSLKTYEIPETITFIDTIERNKDSGKVNYEYYKNLAAEEANADEKSKKSENDVKKLLK